MKSNYTKSQIFNLINLLPEISQTKLRQEIIKGLKSNPKTIPAKFFYDKKGSELFEEITKLDEYYPTRTEISILKNLPVDLIDRKNISIVELGSGDASKISILLDKISKNNLKTIKYIPVDISKDAILKASENLQKKYKDLKITGIVEDFMHQLNLIPQEKERLFCFFGSTLGNLTISQATNFLQNLSDIMQKNDRLLLGIDLVKPVEIIEPAYNDKLRVTEEFNLNILNVVNTIIKSDFSTSDFEHLAFFNKEKSRIEMHLKAVKDITVSSPYFVETLHIKKDETIHTENSHKFTEDMIQEIISSTDLDIKNHFFDKNKWFSVIELIK